MADFKVARCSQQTYDNIQEKDPDKLYFCKDTGNIYLGNIRCGGKDISQPDWEQNEESESSFIKHRTHWKEAVGTDYSSDMNFIQVYSGINTDDGGKMDSFEYGYAKFDVVNQDPESFYDRLFHRNSEAEDSEDCLQGTISWYDEIETGFFEFYDSENNIIAILVTDDYHPQETPFSILLDTGYPSPYNPSSGLTGLYVLNAINGSVNNGEVEGIFDFFVEHETVYHVISKLYLPPVEWNEIEGRTHGIEDTVPDKTIVNSSEFTDDTEYCTATVDDSYTSCYRQFLFVYEDGWLDELYGSLKLRPAGSTEFIDCSEGIPQYNNGDLLLYGNPYLYDDTLDDNGELYVMYRVANDQDSQWTIKVDSEFMWLEGLTELDITDISTIKKLDKIYLPSDVIKWLTQPDWNQSDSSKPDFIKNKPNIPTKTSDLINDGDSSYPNDPFVRKSEIEQPDWEQNEESEVDFIKHRTHYEYGKSFSSSDSDCTVISKDGTDFYYFDYVFNDVSELDNRLLNMTYYNGSYNVKSKLVYIEDAESEYSEGFETYTLGYNIGEGFAEAGIYLPNQAIIDGTTYEAGLYIIKGVTGDVNPYVTEFTISKCIEKLDNKFLNIDDRYYPNSENPQSGKAVAEAIGTVTELIPNGTSSSNQLVNNSQLNDVIDQNAKDYIAPDASMVVPFEYCTYVSGTTNLENGPWYKGGVECGTGQDPVYVVEGDYALVMKDESVCYFEAFGYRYQRHKDGGQTPFGYVVLPDVQHTTTNIAQISGGIYDGALYFVDNTRTFNADNDLLFIVTNLSVLKDSVHVFYASSPSEISGDPIATYDLKFPSTRYRCSIAQTASTNPKWSFMYFVNDTPLSGEYLQVLNSNITAEKVDKLDSIDISHTTTSGLENYTTVTIVVGNKTESFKIYSIDQNFSKSNSKNPVSTAAVYNELSKRVNKTDFENVVKNVVHINKETGDAYLIDDSSDLNYEKAHSIYNVYATITSNNLVLVQDGIDDNTYFYIFDVDNINDNLYLSVRSAQRLRLCLVSDNVDDTAEKVKTRIEGYGHGTGQKYTYHGTWAINLGNDKTYTDDEPYVIDNSGAKHAKVLIIYVGNNDVTPIIRASAGARMDAFLSSVDPDSTNAIQSQAVDKALKDIIVEGYYYNNKFWSDSQHTEEITGVANKLYVDISSNTIYKYVNQSFTKATASLQWGNF